MIAALALTMALAAPATHTVQAVSTATDNVWSPPTLSAKPGDTVVWNLRDPQNPAIAHDIWLKAPSEAAETQRAASSPAVESWSTVVDQVGTYAFVCKVHPTSMAGSIAVAEEAVPPPPPPVDTGPAAAPNPEPAPNVFEEGDTVRPTMSLKRVSVRSRTARVRITTSEAGTLYLRLMRGRKELTTKRFKVRAGTATGSLKLPRRGGKYRLAVYVRDAAGLQCKWRYRTLRVRS